MRYVYKERDDCVCGYGATNSRTSCAELLMAQLREEQDLEED